MKLKDKISNFFHEHPFWTNIISGILLSTFSGIYIFIKKQTTDLSYKEIVYNILNFKFTFFSILLSILIIALLYFIIKSFKKQVPKSIYDERHKLHDKELFQLIKNNIPPKSDTISRIRDFDWGNEFNWKEDLKDFNFIRDNINNPDITFLDLELEEIRKDLFTYVSQFKSYLALKSFPTSDGYSRVPVDWRDRDDSTKYWEIIDKLNSDSNVICKKYDEFILKGKIKFGI